MRTIPFFMVFCFMVAILSPFTNCASVEDTGTSASLDCGMSECSEIKDPTLSIEFALASYTVSKSKKAFQIGGVCNAGGYPLNEVEIHGASEFFSPGCVDGYFTVDVFLNTAIGSNAVTITAKIIGMNSDVDRDSGDGVDNSTQVTIVGVD